LALKACKVFHSPGGGKKRSHSRGWLFFFGL